jgi:uncharacterized membrane protein YcaP (DUF421 family)
MTILELLFRVILSFVILLTLTRIIGRKEISQITFFNFVSSIALGTIGATLAINKTVSIRNGIMALIGWSIITIVLEKIDIKSKKFRKVIEGEPKIVIKNGEIMEDALKKKRLDVDELKSLLRQKNVFSVSDVEFAIFETNGQISVMKKDHKQPITKGDLNIHEDPSIIYAIPLKVISDGEINMENLKKINLDERWLIDNLKNEGVNSVSEVFYAEVQKDGTLYIDKRNDINQ